MTVLRMVGMDVTGQMQIAKSTDSYDPEPSRILLGTGTSVNPTTTETDIPSATVTITPGSWAVFAYFKVGLFITATATNPSDMTCRLRNVTDATVLKARVFGAEMPVASADIINLEGVVFIPYGLDVTVNTVIKMTAEIDADADATSVVIGNLIALKLRSV